VPGFLVVLEFLLLVLGFLAVLVVLLGFLLVFLLVVTSGGAGSWLTPSGIGVTHLGTVRRARRRCRWLTAARG